MGGLIGGCRRGKERCLRGRLRRRAISSPPQAGTQSPWREVSEAPATLLRGKLMPTRRTVRKERALALQPQAKRLFVMRGYPPNGRKGRSSDPPAPSKAEDWQGTVWHDRLLRIYYQDIGTIPRLRPEEERELACDLQLVDGEARHLAPTAVTGYRHLSTIFVTSPPLIGSSWRLQPPIVHVTNWPLRDFQLVAGALPGWNANCPAIQPAGYTWCHALSDDPHQCGEQGPCRVTTAREVSVLQQKYPSSYCGVAREERRYR
jgi:Sigma-70 factor, region 1.2